jgi:predicted DNA-binding transcriptional regulator YafY
MSAAPRLITLIMLLQRRTNQKASDLARELGVSIRTLHRYFDMLDEMGIPVYTERGPYGGFSLVRGYKMPPLVLSPEEAVAVALGTGMVDELWGTLYRDAARGALAKLENLLPDEQRHEVAWARKSLIATGMHRSDLQALGETLEKLRRASRERRRIRMQYQGRSQTEAGDREFDPYAIVHRWGWWYVIGYCHKREAVRTFRIDRIESLILLDEGFDLPADFDVHAYLAQEQASQPGLLVTMRFDAQVAAMARDYAVGWETAEEQPDGSLLVTMAAPDVTWAASNALAYGPAVEVLAPEEVRRTVQEWAQAIVEMYSK